MASYSRKKFARALTDMLQKHDVHDVAQAAAQEIVSQNWMREIDAILKDVATELLSQSNHLEAGVTSAHELSEDIRHAVKNFLTERYKAKEVVLSEQVDPNILGGIQIVTPTEEIDASIKSKLNTLKHHI